MANPIIGRPALSVKHNISAAFLLWLLILRRENAAVAFVFGRNKSRAVFQLNHSQASHHGYVREERSDPNMHEACTFTEEQIHHLIARRLDCKKRREFAQADKILDALHKNGIHLQDKARKYRVDGEAHFGRRKHYVQRGGGSGTTSHEYDPVVEELVEERARYKRRRDYHRSDELTSVLKDEYGVRVDDRRREWSFIVEKGEQFYVPTRLAPKDHPTHTMADETKERIRDRLEERSMARKNKNYRAADRILEELTEEHSIIVDDRTKEWKVVVSLDDSVFDEESENDPFARGAKLSQRSAFVQTRSEVPFGGNRRRNVNTDDDRNEGYSNREDSRLEDELSRILASDDEDVKKMATNLLPPDVSIDEARLSIDEEVAFSTPDEEGITPPEDATKGETADGLASLTVVALKEKLRTAGLPVSGKKAELIDRLLSA